MGRGAAVAGWFNTHARRVTPARVEAFKQALPDARVYAASTFEESKVHADELVRDLPEFIFCGGGDGTIVHLLNSLRERGVKKFPRIGLFKLGTGNGWPSAVGARRYETELVALQSLSRDCAVQRFNLVEVEGRVCQFTGVGWDATLLHDYKRNLEKRQSQLVAGQVATRMSQGVWGYLYSLFRLTVPEELARARDGRTRLRLENIGQTALTLNGDGEPIEIPKSQTTLYEGAVSVGAAGTEPYWGAKFKAFPYARLVPGRFNFRVYDRHVLEGVNNMFKLWRGADLPGMYDWFVTRIRLHLSRPMPYQVGGDVVGEREVIEFGLAKETVELIDWEAARR